MKASFNFQIKKLDGQEIPGDMGNLDRLIAQSLTQQSKGAAIKLNDWALKLWNHETLELDDTDLGVLEGLIDQSEFLNVLSKAPALKLIKAIREKDALKNKPKS